MTADPAALRARKRRDYMVTICDHCRRACCWHGLFYCDEYQSAGTVDVKASDLRREKREHSSYFSMAEIRRVCGDVRYVEGVGHE